MVKLTTMTWFQRNQRKLSARPTPLEDEASEMKLTILEQAKLDQDAFARLSPAQQRAATNELRSIGQNPGVEFPLEDNLVERLLANASLPDGSGMLRINASDLRAALEAQQRKIEGLREALEHIAEEGDAEISPARQLEGCKEIARKALDDGVTLKPTARPTPSEDDLMELLRDLRDRCFASQYLEERAADCIEAQQRKIEGLEAKLERVRQAGRDRRKALDDGGER